MLEFNRKKTYKRILLSPLTLLLLFFILLILLKAVWGVYKKERTSVGYLQKEQEKLAVVVSREKELREAVDYLKTDKGLEAEIRSKFRVVREGESVAVIVDDDPVSVMQATSTPDFWKRVRDWFRF